MLYHTICTYICIYVYHNSEYFLITCMYVFNSIPSIQSIQKERKEIKSLQKEETEKKKERKNALAMPPY